MSAPDQLANTPFQEFSEKKAIPGEEEKGNFSSKLGTNRQDDMRDEQKSRSSDQAQSAAYDPLRPDPGNPAASS